MIRNTAIGLLLLGTQLWLTSCAAPASPNEGTEPGGLTDAALEIGDTIQVRRGVRKERLDLLDRYYAAQRGRRASLAETTQKLEQ